MFNNNGLRDINKSHPVIVLIRKRNDELNTLLLETMKVFIKTSIILLLIEGLYSFFIRENILIIISIFLFNSIINILYIRGAMKNSYTKEIYRMIYSDEFNTVYVNDEIIIDILEKINVIKGKVLFIKEKIIFDTSFLIFLISILAILNI